MQSLINTTKYCFIVALTTLLSPLLVIQGKRVKAKVPRLPEARQPWGKVDYPSDKHIRLLTIGESTIAGVGVDEHKDGFSGALAENLAQSLKSNVDWRVYAKNGATAQITVDEIIPGIPQTKFDFVVIGLGANDAFSFRSPPQWSRQITRIMAALKNIPVILQNETSELRNKHELSF